MLNLQTAEAPTSINVAALREKAERMTRSLMQHRDRYVKAWMAQTGLPPSEAVLVERQAWEGTTMVTIVEVMSKDDAARRFR